MKFPTPLQPAILIRRYKRFLADIRLPDGTETTAHCANPGAMTGLIEPGSQIWVAPSQNPKAKLDWRWEIATMNSVPVCINTMRANDLAAEAISSGVVPELAGYARIRKEVRYGTNSRIDLLLEDDARPAAWVEVKYVTLRRPEMQHSTAAEFPDAITARGTKHLQEMTELVKNGQRAVMLYLVMRNDCDHFRVAEDIDPVYARALQKARTSGVEAFCYAAEVQPDGMKVVAGLPLA